MSKRIVILAVVLLCFGLSVNAEADLWSADVVLKGQSDNQRNAAFKAGLVQVLSRVVVADKQQMFRDQTLLTILESASEYVKHYHPTSLEAPDTDYHMQISYDGTALGTQLMAGQLPVWLGYRPAILLWLVVEDNGIEQFLSPAQHPKIKETLGMTFLNKGLPVIMPLLDLQDLLNITPKNVSSADYRAVKAASQRYGVDTILVGKLSYQKACWQSQWALHFNRVVNNWRQDCVSIERLLEIAMQDVYNQLAQYYAVDPVNEAINEITLKISGINGIGDINRVKRILDSLVLTKSMDLERIEHGHYYYQVKFFGNREILVKNLAVDRLFRIMGKAGKSAGIVWLVLQAQTQ